MHELAVVKRVLKTVWFRPNTIRRSWFSPYRGLRFELSPQISPDRMCIFFRGCEKEVSDALEHLVAPGQTACVVGAHVGMHVLHIAKLLKGRGSVHAFEPWPANFRALERNVQLNRKLAPSIRLNNLAVGGTSGRTEMIEGASDGEHRLGTARDGHSTSVDMTTLDDVFHSEDMQLLLIDVEGFELDVLNGARKLLTRSLPTLIVEHHERARELVSMLSEFGYVTSDLGERHILASVG